MAMQDSDRPSGGSLGNSEAYLDFQQQLSRAAGVDRSVLIIGERGSGKELAASRLHFLSARWQNPFITINCAALPPSLIETELFGHEAGAFTGATKARKGRFEEAHGGTLFLDEIGLIPLEVQEKILRVVEYGTFERVGSSKTYEVDARIVGATNADLPALCRENRFKQDLLDRLSFEVLFLPPLRARGDDILLLAEHFAAKMAYEIGRENIPDFSATVIERLLSYSWPGNVRELKNTIERAVYRSQEDRIEEISLDPFSNPYAAMAPEAAESSSSQAPASTAALVGTPADEERLFDQIPLDHYPGIKERLETRMVLRALDHCTGNQRQAAQLLGLTYDQFRGIYRKMR